MSNDIIRMAQDACSPYQVLNTDPEFLTRFAALVAAHERKRTKDLTDDEIAKIKGFYAQASFETIVRAAIAADREKNGGGK